MWWTCSSPPPTPRQRWATTETGEALEPLTVWMSWRIPPWFDSAPPPSRFLFSPSACLDEHMLQFKFLGILMGVAIRTKKPLDLHLAPLVWKQLCCIPLQLEDLEEVDLLYVQTLKSILHIEDSGITEDNFHEVKFIQTDVSEEDRRHSDVCPLTGFDSLTVITVLCYMCSLHFYPALMVQIKAESDSTVRLSFR